MKPYHILTSFAGSQTGTDECHFEAGTTAALSDALAAIALAEGWVEPVDRILHAPGHLPTETKVTGPEETKPASPVSKKKR